MYSILYDVCEYLPNRYREHRYSTVFEYSNIRTFEYSNIEENVIHRMRIHCMAINIIILHVDLHHICVIIKYYYFCRLDGDKNPLFWLCMRDPRNRAFKAACAPAFASAFCFCLNIGNMLGLGFGYPRKLPGMGAARPGMAPGIIPTLHTNKYHMRNVTAGVGQCEICVVI